MLVIFALAIALICSAVMGYFIYTLEAQIVFGLVLFFGIYLSGKLVQIQCELKALCEEIAAKHSGSVSEDEEAPRKIP